MNIAYCSVLLPENKDFLSKTKYKIPGVAGHKFSTAFMQGIEENLDISDNLKIFGITNLINFPKFPKLFLKKEKWSHNNINEDIYIGYINFFGIKYKTQTHNLYKELKKWVNNLGNEKGIICVYNNFYPIMKAALKIKKEFGNQIQLCLITGDMVAKYNLQSQHKKNIKQKMIDSLENKIFNMVKDFDCFVFATEAMAKAYGVEHKPNVVVECVYLENENYKKKQLNKDIKNNNKIIFYAGAVRSEYGLEHLLNAFSLIKKENYELWIAGGGNCEELVKQRTSLDSRIKFYGFITPEKVEELSNKASVLINPRIATGNEYVKYSFPSKTMEGLASGKPFIAHDLPCYPDEYRKYIQIPNNESDQSLSEKIIEICELSEEERDKIALKARQFVLNEKNPKVMGVKVINMLKEDLLYEKKN